MRLMNQYSMDILKYSQDNGVDIFKEYKKSDITEERKKELEDWLFSLLRSKNEVPVPQYTKNQVIQNITRLSNVDLSTVYRNNQYWYNATCVNLLSSFFPEMFNVRKGAGRDHPTINEYFYDDYMLRKTIKKVLLYDKSELSILTWLKLAGAGFCSNFRPASAMAIYKFFGKEKDCKVFDSSAGYGARLLGAHVVDNVSEYLGIDPNTADSCNKLIKVLDEDFNTNTKKKVLKMGSEDFTVSNFPEYREYFDLYFTSPPYFDTERYSDDETQSYKRFPTYEKWIKGFYRITIYNACDVLKKDGIFILNIFDKVPNIREITKLFLADKGWYIYKIDKYLMRTLPGSIHKFDKEGKPIVRDMTLGKNFEPIYYAKYYKQLLKEGLIDKKLADLYGKRVII